MNVEENLHLATTEELNEMLSHLQDIYEMRDSYKALHPATKFMVGTFISSISTYSRDVELIREELRRREIQGTA